jgi:hypothetical protein
VEKVKKSFVVIADFIFIENIKSSSPEKLSEPKGTVNVPIASFIFLNY